MAENRDGAELSTGGSMPDSAKRSPQRSKRSFYLIVIGSASLLGVAIVLVIALQGLSSQPHLEAPSTNHNTGNSAPPPPQGAGAPAGYVVGTIDSIRGDAIILERSDGSNVNVSASSRTTVTRETQGKVSDLARGDVITAVGQTASDGGITAILVSRGASVNQVPAGSNSAAGPSAAPAGFGIAVGKIEAVEGDSFSVRATDGSIITVSTNSNTRVSTVKRVALRDLAPGESVTVIGMTAASGAIAAMSIAEGATGLGG